MFFRLSMYIGTLKVLLLIFKSCIEKQRSSKFQSGSSPCLLLSSRNDWSLNMKESWIIQIFYRQKILFYEKTLTEKLTFWNLQRTSISEPSKLKNETFFFPQAFKNHSACLLNRDTVTLQFFSIRKLFEYLESETYSSTLFKWSTRTFNATNGILRIGIPITREQVR